MSKEVRGGVGDILVVQPGSSTTRGHENPGDVVWIVCFPAGSDVVGERGFGLVCDEGRWGQLCPEVIDPLKVGAMA